MDEQFDQYGLASVLKDYMYADKATRYQIVKNHFERAVTNAKVGKRKRGRVDNFPSTVAVACAMLCYDIVFCSVMSLCNTHAKPT